MMSNLATLLADLGPAWPGFADDLTDEVAAGLRMSESLYNLRTAAVAEELRILANEEMARAFEEVDLIIAATNPGPAFPADATTSSAEESFLDKALANDAAKVAFRGLLAGDRVATALVPKLTGFLLDQASRRLPDHVNMGALPIITTLPRQPAGSIPAPHRERLPVGNQGPP